MKSLHLKRIILSIFTILVVITLSSCFSLIERQEPYLKFQSFVGGADVDIRSKDAVFYVQKDDHNFWVSEFFVLQNNDLNIGLIDGVEDIVVPSNSSGTGFSIARDVVATSLHVIEDSSEIYVIYDKREYPAEVIFKDPDSDLAILKVEGLEIPYSFNVKDSNSVKAGKGIYVMGFPLLDVLGYEIRVTEGIINAIAGINNNRRNFQISAQIQPGSSGGPIVSNDAPGDVIGIANHKLSDLYLMEQKGTIGQNLNFGNNSDALFVYTRSNLLAQNELVKSLEEAFKATVAVKSVAQHGVKSKKYIFSHNIRTVRSDLFPGSDQLVELELKLFSYDFMFPVASYSWHWVSNYQNAPYLTTQYKKSFSEFIDFLLHEPTDTIRIPEGGDGIFITDGQGTLIGYSPHTENTTENLVIPSKIGEEIITAIGMYAFSENESITSVALSEGITTINESAFYNCRALTDIYLPHSLVHISPWSLFGPTKLNIHYAGTFSEWSHVTKGKKSIDPEYSTVFTL